MSPSPKLFSALSALLLALLSIAATAQEPAQPAPQAAPPVAYQSVSELNNILGQLQQTSKNIQDDLSRTRVDKWKTDSANKRQMQANVESIQRNLQSAVPDMVAQLNHAPEDLAASFKLYRNLDALYDVFGSVVESAGAFGSKDEYQNLSNDMNSLENLRRSLGERVQNLAASKETELAHLRGQIRALQAAPPPPPKKIIVDDTEPPKKKPAKKKAAKPAPATSNNPPSSPPGH